MTAIFVSISFLIFPFLTPSSNMPPMYLYISFSLKDSHSLHNSPRYILFAFEMQIKGLLAYAKVGGNIIHSDPPEAVLREPLFGSIYYSVFYVIHKKL